MSEKKTATREKIYGLSELRLGHGGGACQGCGHPLISKAILEAIEELDIGGRVVHVAGIGCGTMGAVKLDGAMAAHGAAPAIATGIKEALFDDAIVITTQGDGDCAAIGAGYLVAAAARAQRITVFMFNNATYGTTGGQMGPTTLVGQVTSTTPNGRDPDRYGYPLHVPEMLATMKGVVYSARSAINTPANFQRTKKYAKTALQKQIDNLGFSFVEVLTPCPNNWHMTPLKAMKWIGEEMMAEYPLGEFKNVDHID